MADVDDLCQLARSGKAARLDKYLQTYNIDVNALNLYGESALSLATLNNQYACVQILLAYHANPKLRLSAGHTAIHIACQMANIPILHLFLKYNKDSEKDDQDNRYLEDRHIFECLSIKDYSNLTPIDWAATQEIVIKRQQIFSYLDQRMPGVLDSRYSLHWFQSWVNSHPWVIEQSANKTNAGSISMNRSISQTRTGEGFLQHDCHDGSLIPLMNMTSYGAQSIHEYERTPRFPQTATTIGFYDDILVKNQLASKVQPIDMDSEESGLPPTPTTGHLILPQSSDRKVKPVQRTSPSLMNSEDHESKKKLSETNMKHTQKTPYSQRLTAMINKFSMMSPSKASTFRAQRARVIPSGHLPPSPIDIEFDHRKIGPHSDASTPISSKRPSHNLLSNIVPSTSTPSTDRSSRQSSKPFTSFGFDTSGNVRTVADGTNLSTPDTYIRRTPNSDYDDDLASSDTNQVDYLCDDSVSSLGIDSPGVHVHHGKSY